MTDNALQTVHVHDETAALEAAFVPSAGMLCCSLRHGGQELLAQNAGVVAYAQHGKTMGIPLLYPWANRLAAFDYTLHGRTVHVPRDESLVHTDANGLPIHGAIGGRQAWQLTGGGPGAGAQATAELGSDELGSAALGSGEGGASSLLASLTWSEEQSQLFEVFPFRHDLRYEAFLQGERLEISVTVHACGADSVPLAFGFHPYLSPGGERASWQIELPARRALALDAQQIPIAPAETLPAQRFELGGREFDDGFDNVAEAARFSVTGASRRIEVTFLQGYPCAQVFAPVLGQFICFEPMTAPANALRSGDGLRLLAPGERFLARFAVAVSDTR